MGREGGGREEPADANSGGRCRDLHLASHEARWSPHASLYDLENGAQLRRVQPRRFTDGHDRQPLLFRELEEGGGEVLIRASRKLGASRIKA